MFIEQSEPSLMKKRGLHKYYYSGDASKPFVQAEIKKNFKSLLNDPLGRPSFCENNPHCTDDNIEITYDKETGKSQVFSLLS